MALEVTPPTPGPFLGVSSEPFGGVPALLGMADGMADALREASSQLESYSPTLQRDLSDYSVTDYGNLISAATSPEILARLAGDACRAILGSTGIPVTMASSHSITPGTTRATLDRFPDLSVIQINAHADFRKVWENEPWHPHCAMHRVMVHRVMDRIPASKIVSLGVRSGTKPEFQHVKDDLSVLDSDPIYVSIDLSIIDPAFMPWGLRPEPGGLDWTGFATLLSLIPWQNVKAVDLVGLAPGDLAGAHSALFAAKALREILIYLS